MSELQKQLDETVRKSIHEACIGSIDLTLVGGVLTEGAIYLSHSSLTANVWDYVVGGLMLTASIIGLSGATNRFIQMNRYDNECFEIGQQIKQSTRSHRSPRF